MGYGILCCLIAKSCPTFETPWIVALILLPVYFDVQIVLSFPLKITLNSFEFFLN